MGPFEFADTSAGTGAATTPWSSAINTPAKPLRVASPLVTDDMMRLAVQQALDPNTGANTGDKWDAALKFGATLMKPKMPGESTAGKFADASTTAVDHLGKMDAQRKGEAAQRLQSASAASTADIHRRNFDVNMQVLEQKFPLEYAETQSRMAANQPTLLRALLMMENGGEKVKQQLDMEMQTAKNIADKAAIEIQSARTDLERKQLAQKHEKRIAAMTESIPDGEFKKNIEATLREPLARLNLLGAQAASASQAAHLSGAKAEEQDITNKTLKGMDDKELKEFLTKTGRYATSTSAIMAQSQMWGSIYDKLPDNDPMKKGKTREQFQMERLQSAKQKDILELLVKYQQSGGDDQELIGMMLEQAKSSVAARAGAAPAGTGRGRGNPGGPVEFVRDPVTNRLVRKDQAAK